MKVKLSGETMRRAILVTGILLMVITMITCTSRYERHYKLGKWYYNKGLLNEAILEFKAATRVQPDRYQGHHSLAIAYTKKGWYEYALKEAKVAFNLHPSDENYRLIQLIKEKDNLKSLQSVSPDTTA